MTKNDLSSISSEAIKRQLEEFYVQRLKCNDVKLTVESGSKHGDNFIGIVYRVSGEKSKCDNDKNEKLNIILKVAPSNKMRREKFFARPSFLREIFVYEEVRELKYFHVNRF